MDLNSQVEQVLKLYAEGIEKKDWHQLSGLYTDDVVVYDAWDNWTYTGKEWHQQLHHYIDSMGEEHDQVRMTDLIIHAEDSVAFVSALFTYARHDAAGKFLAAMLNRISLGLIRQEGGWKIAHEHTSIPVGFESGKGIFRVTFP